MTEIVNYPKELLEKIYSFYEKAEFSDVTLIAGVNKIKYETSEKRKPCAQLIYLHVTQ